ncbi:hypothetical protein GCM10027277_57040 [Pseudoduganella ginsengisoli]|uniref:Uncharacterized protein n=1 Tax=Pseudoduganella ginsengisoli TaxID=1462440 RepID=A0A6L6Q290_9BURK|nr:hypothetical protein [Pseudoduganella ginsengisoli]MTW03626.1 hypothetical protein [Pseudoduganella ginsengisoli]
MKYQRNRLAAVFTVLAMLAAQQAGAHAVSAKQGNVKDASFDIVNAEISVDAEKNQLVFAMSVAGTAGAVKPKKTGKFEGSDVFSYVWPTKIDPSEVGFDKGAGILALAVTTHPDFDDTPLFDTKGNDWHSHWVVLAPDEACGKGALKVKDIPAGTRPKLPKTWPGVPLLIDSPGYAPRFAASTVKVRVPFDDVTNFKGVAFDGVTAGLRVGASPHQPLLCVVNVFDVASGDLSLPGKAE